MEKVRVQKVIAEAGICSRRKAEELILKGKVKVNGHPCELGTKVDPAKDLISVNDENIYVPKRKKYRYLMMNKPRGYVTTVHDEQDRRTVMDLLEGVQERVYPIGRLDRNSEGLLLFTNDGNLANALMHPSREVNKVYRVTVRPDISDEQLITLSEGVSLEDGKTAPATVRVLNKEPGRVVIEMVIHEGRNRQIRRMCEAVGLEVARLKRTAIGPIRLGMLKPGTVRDLTAEELKAIRNAITKVD